jgi:hypothetical protein
MNKFYKTRIGQYTMCAIIYTGLWKIFGFEFAVVVGLATIIGELFFKDIENQKEK